MNSTTRYTDTELANFKDHINKKLAQAKVELSYLNERLEDITDHMSNEGDWMDDTSNNTDFEMMTTMANRNRKYIVDLENALLRIQNKSYGICIVSGQLIDARRLMAVPTTTKSLVAKTKESPQKKKSIASSSSPSTSKQPKIITKIIRKKNPSFSPSEVDINHIEEEEEFYDQEFIDNMDSFERTE